jgi:hypothetical protein
VRRRGKRTNKTKVNEKEHYTQSGRPTAIITETRMSSGKESNYTGHDDVATSKSF